jgi:hypothetical protein
MTLDVLLLEAGPGDGTTDALHLEDAGHHVHRCFDAHTAGSVHPSGWVPCRALTAGDCPLDGSIDVALLARRGVTPRPGPREAGVRCAVRSGVPIVEDGGDLLDPFAQWISRRTDDIGVVAACEAAATEAFAPVVDRLRTVSSVLLADLDVDPSGIDAAFEVDGDQLELRRVVLALHVDADLAKAGGEVVRHMDADRDLAGVAGEQRQPARIHRHPLEIESEHAHAVAIDDGGQVADVELQADVLTDRHVGVGRDDGRVQVVHPATTSRTAASPARTSTSTT